MCLHDLPVKLIGNGGGLVYAPLGPTHQAIEDISILRTLPNITIFTPGSREEAIISMEESLKIDSVCYIRIDKSHFFEENHCIGNPINTEPRELFVGDKTVIIGVGGIGGYLAP